ncbi:hypothetical protein [Lacisediminihabitans sp. H27-G8]|uniref:hypothetical protein n=1 Tax=Lacisediminihabitans sp. H27-G8 TaxID=3111909 RepID=UPI0038FD095C
MAAQRTAQQSKAVAAAGFALLAAVVGLSGCTSTGTTSNSPPPASATGNAATPTPRSTEVSPAGDIPDNQAFVPFLSPDGTFSVAVPEGWAQSQSGAIITFADKLNVITVVTQSASAAPTVTSVTNGEVVSLRASEAKFFLTDVKSFSRAGGSGVLITFQSDSAVNQVTGSVVRNEVEQYLFWKGGKQVTVTLTSPKGSDNVDPWAKVTGSFVWLAK